MQIIARDTDQGIARMLDGYEYPAILVTAEYRILATNELYRKTFGEIEPGDGARCYQVSHGYDRPCDQAGEDCPLAAAQASGQKERVLHIHQTPRGKEHVDVELLPIRDEQDRLKYFVELLKPVPIASTTSSMQALTGSSPAFNKMLELISRVGPSEASVVLLGESGTGKELAAHALHQISPRADKPLVTLECSGLTETLFESELFGHIKGAFTGANYTRQGLAEAVDGGTFFLDEVGDIPYPLQVKLLRLIETGTYRPVGSSQIKRTDFRLICATHKNLWQMVEEGSFREDLYYRINLFPIHVPPLDERVEDIPQIAQSLLEQLSGAKKYHLTQSAMRQLSRHRYKGNIRELKNILSCATVLANTNVIDHSIIGDCLEIHRSSQRMSEAPLDLKSMERNYLQRLMRVYDNDKKRVAEVAGISVRSLYRKLQETLESEESSGVLLNK
ncbi:sigma-54-dependent Fis family transcriptional regulator [Aestuariirhabdus sp. Z084]|uniref:sigma-54 interaction domain-containing protein n=1 Tax=Aestuariirhabdus haliotis TaxID=2918751 RepID=UPI00201B3797|nr:sigma-54-dependent Fis family transcriptional regulator [Aestuariirhabdus haliotis]MCL6417210.1 sigma-54-dependent Fis family transcriptional regulator [Aestuariirhabdus haliotis]MCL6421182.1 sigma-54-dependent Fis family transcriptional regulator [Aestuariirhabdus haliotis]